MSRPFPWLTVGVFAILAGAAVALGLGALLDQSREAVSTAPLEPINGNHLPIPPFLPPAERTSGNHPLIRPFLVPAAVAGVWVLRGGTGRGFAGGGPPAGPRGARRGRGEGGPAGVSRAFIATLAVYAVMLAETLLLIA